MSIEFHLLRPFAGHHVLAMYFDRSNDAESMFLRERNAAIRIQRRWRGYRDRKYIFYLHTQATHIQRTYRAFRDRRRARLAKSRKQQLITHRFHADMATKIQKIIRGWLSRRLVANFYARREYLRTLLQQGNAMEQEMHERYLHEQAAREEEKAVREDQEFEKLTENLHHLLSTKAIPGVFSSRLGDAHAPSVYNIPMETHIKDQFVNRQRRLQKMRADIDRQSKRIAESLQVDIDNDASSSSSSSQPPIVMVPSQKFASPSSSASSSSGPARTSSSVSYASTKVPRDRVLPPIVRTRSNEAAALRGGASSEEEKQQAMYAEWQQQQQQLQAALNRGRPGHASPSQTQNLSTTTTQQRAPSPILHAPSAPSSSSSFSSTLVNAGIINRHPSPRTMQIKNKTAATAAMAATTQRIVPQQPPPQQPMPVESRI